MPMKASKGIDHYSLYKVLKTKIKIILIKSQIDLTLEVTMKMIIDQ